MVDVNNNKIKGGAGFVPDVVQREVAMVKPGSETRKGLYFLSNLDQVFSEGHVRTLYCFKSEERGNEEAAQVIKKALSQLLVHYYPLAGRLTICPEGKLAVDCTGEGVVFVEAEANCKMDEYGNFNQPGHESLKKLVYDVVTDEAMNIFQIPLVIAQVTKFKCGGFVLGLSNSHCMLDGIAAMDFITSLSQVARGLPLTTPFLDRTILSARDPPKIEYLHQEFQEMENKSHADEEEQEPVLYKSFCFDQERIKKLKLQATENSDEPLLLTTFEAVAGFVWRARTKSMKMLSDQKTRLLISVDGRAKFEPRLPETFFGNGIAFTGSVCEAGELIEKPLSFSVGLVRKMIKRVTDGYMRSAIDYYEVNRAKSSLFSTVIITSWSRLDFHSTDFGWGEPVFTGPVGVRVKELAILMSHGEPNSRSINLLLGLPASAMDLFQQQFLQI